MRLTPSSRAGAAILLCLAALGLFAPLLCGSDPLAIDLESRLMPPGSRHLLGTDELGRDILSRLFHAARASLTVAVMATVVSLLIGIPLGALAGYGGRAADMLFSRLIDLFLSFPSLVLLLLLTAITMRPTIGNTAGTGASESVFVVGCAVGIARWGIIARYMKGEVMRISGTDLAQAARATGASRLRILCLHLIPGGLAPVMVSAAFGAGTAVVAEASLSFLGLGVQPPMPTWGQMLASAAAAGPERWWLLVFPGLMVMLTVGAFNLMGDGLRQVGESSR